MSKSTKRPFWQDEPCPSWCMGGHQDVDAVVDRHHFSRWEKRIAVSMYDAWHVSYTAEQTPAGEPREYTEPIELVVILDQRFRECAPRVVIDPEGSSKNSPGGLELTVVEADKLGRALLKAVRLAGE